EVGVRLRKYLWILGTIGDDAVRRSVRHGGGHHALVPGPGDRRELGRGRQHRGGDDRHLRGADHHRRRHSRRRGGGGALQLLSNAAGAHLDRASVAQRRVPRAIARAAAQRLLLERAFGGTGQPAFGSGRVGGGGLSHGDRHAAGGWRGRGGGERLLR